MSHYWNLDGDITLSRVANKKELARVTEIIYDFRDCIHIHENNKSIVVEGNENHFPNLLEEVLQQFDKDVRFHGGGTYHAEDCMSGEWEILGRAFLNKEYSEIVEALRDKVDKLEETIEQLITGGC